MAQDDQAQIKRSYAEILKTATPAKLIETPKPKTNEIHVYKNYRISGLGRVPWSGSNPGSNLTYFFFA